MVNDYLHWLLDGHLIIQVNIGVNKKKMNFSLIVHLGMVDLFTVQIQLKMVPFVIIKLRKIEF